MSKDRRRYPRHDSWFPVQIDSGDDVSRIAVCVDGSANGLLVKSATPFAPGDTVSVVFKVMPSQPEWIRAEAEIVRCDVEVVVDDEPNPWPITIALRLTTPIPKLEPIYSLAESKRRYGDHRSMPLRRRAG